MQEQKERHERNTQLMNFLRANGYAVHPTMSTDGQYVDSLEVAYGEIPDQTEHTKPTEITS